MHPPVDYPIDDETAATPAPVSTSGEVSYAALLDLYEAEQPITEAMIRQACQRMDEAQQFPFASLDSAVNAIAVDAINQPTSVSPTTPGDSGMHDTGERQGLLRNTIDRTDPGTSWLPAGLTSAGRFGQPLVRWLRSIR